MMNESELDILRRRKINGHQQECFSIYKVSLNTDARFLLHTI